MPKKPANSEIDGDAIRLVIELGAIDPPRSQPTSSPTDVGRLAIVVSSGYSTSEITNVASGAFSTDPSPTVAVAVFDSSATSIAMLIAVGRSSAEIWLPSESL